MPNWDPDEHPEDRSARIRREAYGRTRAKTFAEDHARDMTRLIELYADDEAGELLHKLRELFWAELWTPADTAAIIGVDLATDVSESQDAAPSAQALPDDRPGLGTGGGAASWDSELAAIRLRAASLPRPPVLEVDADCIALLGMLDRQAELTRYDAAAKAALQHCVNQLQVAERTARLDLAERTSDLERSREFSARLSRELEQAQIDADCLRRLGADHVQLLRQEKGRADQAAAMADAHLARVKDLEQQLVAEKAINEGRLRLPEGD